MSMSDLQCLQQASFSINLHNNTFDVESNQYGEVVQFFQESRIDSKDMHLFKDINYWILVRDFDCSRRFHK